MSSSVAILGFRVSFKFFGMKPSASVFMLFYEFIFEKAGNDVSIMLRGHLRANKSQLNSFKIYIYCL